jgi:hypothetical protein
MKLSIQIFFLFFALFVQAQDFKPYKIESGKIIYEKLKYSTVSGYSYVNGVETGYSKQVPYTAEQVIYYWDNFGDIAFEESYQVSEFGGKALPEKVKIGERCWIDEQCYYFDAKENIVAVGPFYLRIKCIENFQYYQIMGSWIETQYMGAEKSGTKIIMGEMADYYKIDTDQDIYAWKGLILKEDDFSTNSKGDKRYDIERTKIAVEIDTVHSIDKYVFNPVWLVREQTYQSFDRNKIDEYLDSRMDILEQADNVEGIKIRTNDILLFVTTDYKLGKMQVQNIDENNSLNIKYSLYDQTNEVSSSNKKLIVENNALLDIDNEIINETDTEMLDFKWRRINNNSNLFPQNNIGVYLLKASRTSTF